ncbi:hypothetical protein HY450_01225 [Candidatus Pacearchaeota archaeon]|nr:hypothetical protein [Candidatus Pacearchaeota archaeon]
MSFMDTEILWIVFISLLIFPIVSALEFELISPNSVNSEEEFDVSILSNENIAESYDVKVFVHEPVKEFSEIFDGQNWKSPHFYLNGVFPDTTQFRIISHFVGETNICARLRKSSGGNFEEVCNSIEVLKGEVVQDEEILPEEETIEEEDDSSEEPIAYDEPTEKIEEKKVSPKIEEKIVLNSPVQNEESSEVFETKQGKERRWLLYGFGSLLILIIVLLGLRRI